LDTAPWYGHGISEIVVGYALDTILVDDDHINHQLHGNENAKRKRRGSLPRSSIIVNTKVGRYEADPLHQFDFSYATTMSSARRSIERMNCGYIDVLQLHDPEFAPSMSILMEETIPALIECRNRGWTKAIGITGYPLEVQHEILVRCFEVFSDEVVFDQSLVYCHNNLHDMSLFGDRCFPMTEGDDEVESFAQYCRRSNVCLMTAAPLSMGLLTNAGPPSWHPALPSLKKACDNAAKMCQARGIDISSLAMLYAFSQKEVGCTLIGMKDINQVDVAADFALRFDVTDDANVGLRQVLSDEEYEMLTLLLHVHEGPFASVWSNSEYRWDGKAEAKKFWAMIER
jgi:L-galactose dehydrogenase